MRLTEGQLRNIIREAIKPHACTSLAYSDYVSVARSRWSGLVLEAGIREASADLMLLTESSAASVGDILAQFDDAASDLDNKVMDFVKSALKFANQFTPDAIEAASGEEVDDKDVDGILEFFSELKGMFDDVMSAIKSAGDSVKKQVKAFFKEGGKKILEGFSNLKELYEENKVAQAVFKKIGGEAIKSTIKKLVEKVAPLIPYGGTVLAAAKTLKGVAETGGKLAGMFSRFSKEKNKSPQEKFAEFAAEIARGPDNDALGDLASILQMNDDIEDILDDKVEVQFVEYYVDHLREIDPSTPIENIDINNMLTDWIKDELGAQEADVAVAGA